MAFVAQGACPEGPKELQECVVQFICSQSTAFPLSVVGLNADLRRAYQRAGRPFSELRAFRAGSTGEAVRAVAAALQGMGRGKALQLEDTTGVEDLLVVEADRQAIRDALLVPAKAAASGGEKRRKLPQPGPGAAGGARPAPAPAASEGPLGGLLAGDGDDELTRLLAAPTVLTRGPGDAAAPAEAPAEEGGGESRRRRGEDRDRRRRRREDAQPAAPDGAGAQPDSPAPPPPPQAPQQQPPPAEVWVFTPDGSGDVLPDGGGAAAGEAAALQPGLPAPESPKRTLKTMPMFQWVSASSVEGLKHPSESFRRPPRGRSRSRSPRSPPKLAPGEVPLKLAGEAWEEPRQTSGLRLVADGPPPTLASSGAGWVYPVADESRRSFAGYLRGALSAAACEEYFARIRDGTRWQQPEGPMGPMPRKTCWMVSGGCSCMYRYGGIEVPPTEFPAWMTELMGVVMPMCGLSREQWPGACNLNLYEDGGMSVGWHADDERLFQGRHRDCQIVSLSLGARRTFELRLNFPEEGEHGFWRVPLGSGDLLTMEGMAQKHFQHRVPREENVRGPRINLTWRHVLKHAPSCPVKRRRH